MITAALTELKANGVDVLKHEILGIRFSQKEFAVFLCLLNSKVTLSDTEIEELINSDPYNVETGIIKASVFRIREKLAVKYKRNTGIIERIQNRGYRINLTALNKIIAFKKSS